MIRFKLSFIKQRTKILVLITGLCLLAIHFSLVVVHATPFVSDQHKLFYTARSYAGTFFHQSWNVFVPPPNTNYKLFVSFENKGIQKKEIFTDLLSQHQSNRLKGYEPLVMGFSNTLYVFEKSTPLQEKLNGPVLNDVNFTMIERAAKNYIQNTYNIKIDTLQLMLFVENAITKEQRVYFNQAASVHHY